MKKHLFLLLLVCLSSQSFIVNAFAATDISKDISQNTTWNVAGSPYIVTGNITLYAQLVIDPGVTVAFNSGASLAVGGNSIFPGSIIAVGNSSQAIRFTSNQTNPLAGDWGGITLSRIDPTPPESRFEYCVFEYGGAARSAMMQIQDSSPFMSHCQINRSASNGIEISSSLIRQSKPTITSCMFIRNRLSALTLDARSNLATIRDSLFQENRSYPILTPANALGTLRQNTFVNNTPNAIEVTGGTITSTQTIANQGIPYVVSGSAITVYRAEMAIDPGVVFRFQTGTSITIDDSSGGTITAIGEASNPVLFSSNQDSPSPGDWQGISLLAEGGSPSSNLQYCIIEYAGQSGSAAIYVYSSKPTVKYNSIRYSANDGVRIGGFGLTNPSIAQNNFYENRGFNLNNRSTAKVIAKNNWWGSVTGPQGINGDVDVSNPLTTPVLIGFPRSPLLLFFPHFAAGDNWKTLIFLSNLESIETSVNVRFWSDDGNAQSVTIQGVTSSSFNFDIVSDGMAAIEVTGQLNTGWAEILPQTKVAGSMVFQYIPQGFVVSAGGVLPGEMSQRFTIPFVTSQASGAALGFAIANPNLQALDVRVELFGDTGLKNSETMINLPAHGHIARYIDQLFPQSLNWSGFIRLTADLQFTVLPLRFDGSVFSTIPAVRVK